MRDTEVRLTDIYVTPTGSPVPSNTPNSEDTPAGSFDLVICGEEGDQLYANGSNYVLSYWIVDLQTMDRVAAAATNSNAVHNQNTGGAQWTALPPNNESYYTVQRFNISNLAGAGLSGHILQAYAVLQALHGDIVSFVQSEPFVLV